MNQLRWAIIAEMQESILVLFLPNEYFRVKVLHDPGFCCGVSALWHKQWRNLNTETEKI